MRELGQFRELNWHRHAVGRDAIARGNKGRKADQLFANQEVGQPPIGPVQSPRTSQDARQTDAQVIFGIQYSIALLRCGVAHRGTGVNTRLTSRELNIQPQLFCRLRSRTVRRSDRADRATPTKISSLHT